MANFFTRGFALDILEDYSQSFLDADTLWLVLLQQR